MRKKNGKQVNKSKKPSQCVSLELDSVIKASKAAALIYTKKKVKKVFKNYKKVFKKGL